jgi:hypothetical protein
MKIYTKEINKCLDCPIRIIEGKTDIMFCNYTGQIITDNNLYKIPKWCPLPDKEKRIAYKINSKG